MSSTPGMPSSGWTSTGIPRPSSTTVSESSAWRTTESRAACPTMASSTLLSTTSCARWFGRAVSVYMPGRLRTGSSPARTSMEAAS